MVIEYAHVRNYTMMTTKHENSRELIYYIYFHMEGNLRLCKGIEWNRKR